MTYGNLCLVLKKLLPLQKKKMIPPFNNYFYPFLQTLQDGQIRKVSEISNDLIKTLNLSAEEINEKTKGGKNRHYDRIKWVIAYLNKMGVIERASKGCYKISDEGIIILSKHGDNLSLQSLRDEECFLLMKASKKESISHYVEPHYNHKGRYIPGYFSNSVNNGIRKRRPYTPVKKETK